MRRRRSAEEIRQLVNDYGERGGLTRRAFCASRDNPLSTLDTICGTTPWFSETAAAIFAGGEAGKTCLPGLPSGRCHDAGRYERNGAAQLP